jgi:hypothetical protein
VIDDDPLNVGEVLRDGQRHDATQVVARAHEEDHPAGIGFGDA